MSKARLGTVCFILFDKGMIEVECKGWHRSDEVEAADCGRLPEIAD